MYLGSPRMAEVIARRCWAVPCGCGHALVKSDAEGIALATLVGISRATRSRPHRRRARGRDRTPLEEDSDDENKPFDMRLLAVDTLIDAGLASWRSTRAGRRS